MPQQAPSEQTHNRQVQTEQASVEVPIVEVNEPAKVVTVPVSTIAEEAPCCHDEKQ